MLNDNFARIEMFYKAIDEINTILAYDDDDVRNYNCKLDAVLSAVTDIRKSEFDKEISDTIIMKIKEAIEDIYTKELSRMHHSIGMNISFEHCEIKKEDLKKDDIKELDDEELLSTEILSSRATPKLVKAK